MFSKNNYSIVYDVYLLNGSQFAFASDKVFNVINPETVPPEFFCIITEVSAEPPTEKLCNIRGSNLKSGCVPNPLTKI
jgi:hypothetical protein